MGSGLTKVPAEKVALAHCDQTVTAKAARSNFVSPPFKIQNKVAVCTVPFCDILYICHASWFSVADSETRFLHTRRSSGCPGISRVPVQYPPPAAGSRINIVCVYNRQSHAGNKLKQGS